MIHLNKEYKRRATVEPSELLLESDVTSDVDAITDVVSEQTKDALQASIATKKQKEWLRAQRATMEEQDAKFRVAEKKKQRVMGRLNMETQTRKIAHIDFTIAS